tara:strand:- start:1938 stop:2807 length:870 start_codon:yes stop_codon:yes gene_type:complete
MPLSDPLPFQAALDAVTRRIPAGRPWSAAEWAAKEPEVRDRALFSARVENEMVLKRIKLFLLNFLERQREPVPGGEGTRLRDGSQTKFVTELRALAIREGVGIEGVPDSLVDEGNIRDIRSEARLRLIFQTQVSTSYGYGSWTQGMTPVVLDAFPAARVVRNPGAVTPRPRHVQEEGSVRLKTDYDFWAKWMNGREIGGFQVPYGPFGYNSFIDQADVSRAEAERLQLVPKGANPRGPKRRLPGLNDEVRASVAALDKAERASLMQELQGVAEMGYNHIKMIKKPTDRP